MDELQQTLHRELNAFREETQQREDSILAQHSEVAHRQRDTLERLIRLQSEEAETRAERQQLWNKLLAALVAILTAAAGSGVWLGSQRPTEAQIKEETRPVVKAVTERVDVAEVKIERLKDVALEQQVQIADSVEYIGAKIDAIAPRRSPKVDVPPSLKAAQKKAEAIKRQKTLFEEADPFAGLD